MQTSVQMEALVAPRERFYRSVAATLAVLHAAGTRLSQDVLGDVARTLADAMDLPLVWLGELPAGGHSVRRLAAAGPAQAYIEGLSFSDDPELPGGQGPLGQALRSGHAQISHVDEPLFERWRERAQTFGLAASMVVVAPLADGGRLSLSVYVRTAEWLDAALVEWAERLVAEIARYVDHCALAVREQRLRRFRDAQRVLQRALLKQPDPEAVYETLAHALVEVAGAAVVDVLIDEGAPLLRRMALAGPMADAIHALPRPPARPQGAIVPTPTRAFAEARPIVRVQPALDPGIPEGWRRPPLVHMGAVAAWPIFGTLQGELGTAAKPSGVFALTTREPDSFDDELRALLDQIADATGLALRQHAQRELLASERERQRHLALHDVLTGLPNRRALEHQMEGSLARARRHHLLVGIGMLDLDDFKPINDRLGHAAGDRLLMEVADRLRGAVRAEDYVARLGGDEFVLVFEDIARTEDLGPLVDRLHAALQRPFEIDGNTLALNACLGIALFPLHAESGGEQLLRRADQAMYQVKARKHQGGSWWSLPPHSESGESTPSEAEAGDLPAYGAPAARLLGALTPTAREALDAIVDPFYAEVTQMPEPRQVLACLPQDELAALYAKQREHIRLLVQPELDAATHRALADRAGRVHAACGIEAVWLSDGVERLREGVETALAKHLHRDRRALLVVRRRLAQDRQWQLEGLRAVQRERDGVIARISALAWSAESYLALMQGVVDLLVAHDEIISATVGRPDDRGVFTYEAVAGNAFRAYLDALAQGKAAVISSVATDPHGRGPSGRAWRSGVIERCAHYRTDPLMRPWRDLVVRLGIRSSVALPLCTQDGVPAAVLVLYSSYPGGFASDAQQAFVAQLKTLLDLALVRIAPGSTTAGTILPYTVRTHWRSLLAAPEGLELHYQPVLALRTGRPVEVEALARLREADGSLLPPNLFLAALGRDDLLLLFQRALKQALAQYNALAAAGHSLDVTVNLPPAALHDGRYVEVARQSLGDSGVPPSALLLEVLEGASEAEQALESALAGIEAFKVLGVRVVEDDLGAGHSSLARLRRWPFDRVKIDQTLVRDVAQDPLRTLRFMHQLCSLGRGLGIEVVVEGLETQGLIEAALILGADLGQGYAIARPMPADSLAKWLEHFTWRFSSRAPRTALGALAGSLLWDEALQAGGDHPELWTHLATVPCLVHAFLDARPEYRDLLDGPHARMHRAARRGPRSGDYEAARAEFEESLVRCVRAEEAAIR